MKWFLVVLMVIHGLIHLMGGVNELGLAKIDNVSAQTLIPISEQLRSLLGVFWLLAVAAFLIAAVGLLTNQQWWKPVTIGAVTLSQVLIILWWPAAKVGAVANGLILVGLFLL